jgi:hypothetical protein
MSEHNTPENNASKLKKTAINNTLPSIIGGFGGFLVSAWGVKTNDEYTLAIGALLIGWCAGWLSAIWGCVLVELDDH